MNGYDYCGFVSANLNVNWNRYGVVRIALESLDATLEVCNSLGHFGENKIFDVFDQTFPTASILNTGYWIFFVSNYGASLCICGRFGIVCRHVKSKNHWIDLQPIAERSGAVVFVPKIYGPVIPTRYEITVNYLSETLGCMINIDMDLAYANMCKQKYHIHIQARYGYANQWYGAPCSIRFTPNPILKEQYGKYFDKLRNHRLIFIHKYGHEDLIVTPTTMPPSCLLLISVNVAKHEIPHSLLAILMNDARLSTEYSRDVSTQTIETKDLDYYANLLHEVTTRIWGYRDNNGSKFPILEEYFKNTLPYTELEFEEYPMGIHDPEEYDIEFPEFGHKKSMYTGNRKTIAENSIPRPILSSFVQNSSFSPKTENFRAKDKLSLPNFGEAFTNQEPVPPICDNSCKRKRGRPKLQRGDGSKSYSVVTKPEKSSFSLEKYTSSTDGPGCEKYNGISSISESKQQTSDTSFTMLNNIFELSNERNVNHQVKDINFELDIIDQLIKEDSDKHIFEEY